MAFEQFAVARLPSLVRYAAGAPQVAEAGALCAGLIGPPQGMGIRGGSGQFPMFRGTHSGHS